MLKLLYFSRMKLHNNKIPTEIEKGIPLKLALIIIVVTLLLIIFSCCRQSHRYIDGIYIPTSEEMKSLDDEINKK